MRHFTVLLILAVLLTGLVNYPTVSAATGPRIIVHVTDQLGVWYNGVVVEIYQQPSTLVSNGTTANGKFYSGVLTANQNYTVNLFSSTGSDSKAVQLGSYDANVTFALYRPLPPNLALIGVSLQPQTINPGTTFNAQLTVVNTSNATAYNSFLQLQVSSPFTLQGTGSTLPLGTMAPNTSNLVTPTFSVAETAQVSSYRINYILNFTDYARIQYSSNGSFGVSVTGSPVRPRLIVTSVSFSPNTVTPGSNFQSIVKVQNVGNQVAYASFLTLNPTASLGLSGSAGIIPLGSMSPLDNRTLTVSMFSSSAATTGSYRVDFTLSYSDILGTLYNDPGSFTVILMAEPSLKVQTLRFRNSPLTPALDTFVYVGLTNSGGDKAFGVAIYWYGSAPFLTNSTSYVGTISSGGTANATFFVRIPSQTPIGTYRFNLTVSYEDLLGTSFATQNQYSIDVQPYSPPMISVANTLIDPPVLSPGTQGTFTVFLRNDGKTQANSLLVKISGASDILASTSFGAGNLDAGAQTTSVIGVNVNQNFKPGTYTLVVTASYTDPAGVGYVSSIPIEITVYPSVNIFSPTNIAVMLGLALSAGATVVVYGYLRKHQSVRQGETSSRKPTTAPGRDAQ